MTPRKTLALLAIPLILGAAVWLPLSGPTAIAPAAAAAGAPDLQDLVGGRATAGQAELRARGFVAARLRGLDAYWWHARTQRCIHSTTAEGLYRRVSETAATNCGM